jgi:hypothetical protein
MMMITKSLDPGSVAVSLKSGRSKFMRYPYLQKSLSGNKRSGDVGL